MTSEKQIKANKENGKKLWIKTALWKQRSSMNALKYGLSSSITIDDMEKEL